MSRVLGIDYGTKRVGVAISDPLGMTAQPLEVISASAARTEIARLAADYDVERIVVGLPVGLSGTEGPAAAAARAFAEELRESSGIAVEMVDERFSTSTAERTMKQAGVAGRRRRHLVDKVAATVILQDFLDRR